MTPELSAAIARLEACPFCGNENVECNVRGGPMWVECPQCEATGPLAEMPNTAAAVWNRRVARTQTAEIETLRAALGECLIGGNHLATHLLSEHPPYTASCDDALEYYGAGWRYDVWCCWRALMRAREAYEASDGKEPT